MSEVELRAISLRRGGKELLRAVDLRLRAGEFLALVGPNGAGKSSLLRVALGLERAAEGQALLNGTPLRERTPREKAAHLGWLPQHSRIVEPILVLDQVLAARYRFSETRAHATSRARAALSRVGALELESRQIFTLSGGERQRVSLAALLAQETPLLLLDEPGNHLDPSHQHELYRLLGELWHEGRGVLCITHDVSLLGVIDNAEAIRVVGIKEGKLSFESTFGSPELPDRLGELFQVTAERLQGPPGGWLVLRPQIAAPRSDPKPSHPTKGSDEV